MSEDEKFRQLRRQIHEGIEQVRHSVQRAKWLLSRIGEKQAANTVVRGPKCPVDGEGNKSRIA
jgi:hypothetical protein